MNKDYIITYNNTYFADFETVTSETEYYKKYQDSRVLAWCIMDINQTEKMGVDIQSFIESIKNLHHHTNYIYFHNLSFDGTFILKHIVKIGFKPTQSIYLHDKEFYVFRNGNTIYRIELKIGKKLFIFKCSYKLFNASIEQLGKSFDIQKHKEGDGVAFYDLEPQKHIAMYSKRFIEYLRNDVIVMIKSFETLDSLLIEYQDFTYERINLNEFTTTGSLSRFLMEKWTNKYNPHIDYLHVSEKHINDERLSGFYAGGLSQINTNYTYNLFQTWELQNAIFIDINSAYPYHMTKPLPYGEPMTSRTDTSDIELYNIWIDKATIKDKYKECVFLKKWGKSINDVERYAKKLAKVECVYFKEEWEQLNELYDIDFKINQVFYFKTDTYLKEYINLLYKHKKHYKETNQIGLLLMVKILLNSSYGALAMGNDYPTGIYTTRDKVYEKSTIIKYRNSEYEVKRESELFNINETYTRYYVCNEIERKQRIYNKYAAAYITACERAYLINKVIELKKTNSEFLLCDTDSILINKLTNAQIKKIQNESNEELGVWSVENKKPIHYFKTFGVKKYVLLDEKKQEIKTRFAGVSSKSFKRIESLRWDEPTIEFEEATLQRQYTESGIVLIWKEKKINKGKN